jgi:hypothetical protein
MRALSVIQPWAHCIVCKGKNVENRPRITHLRGTIAIHASVKRDQERFDWLKEDHGIGLHLDDVTYGAIVGFAEISEVITRKGVTKNTTKWFGGKYGYVLKNVVLLKQPVPIKGSLGFWRLKGAPLRRCLNQLNATQVKRIRPFERP